MKELATVFGDKGLVVVKQLNFTSRHVGSNQTSESDSSCRVLSDYCYKWFFHFNHSAKVVHCTFIGKHFVNFYAHQLRGTKKV